jgi:hypothetical protein
MLQSFPSEGPRTCVYNAFAIKKVYIFIESNFNFVVSHFLHVPALLADGIYTKENKSKDVVEPNEFLAHEVNPPLWGLQCCGWY